MYEKETSWGVHEVTKGRGKYAGKFIAQSTGWGGARGYFKVFDTFEDAKAYVDNRTRPLSQSDAIKF